MQKVYNWEFLFQVLAYADYPQAIKYMEINRTLHQMMHFEWIGILLLLWKEYKLYSRIQTFIGAGRESKIKRKEDTFQAAEQLHAKLSYQFRWPTDNEFLLMVQQNRGKMEVCINLPSRYFEIFQKNTFLRLSFTLQLSVPVGCDHTFFDIKTSLCGYYTLSICIEL